VDVPAAADTPAIIAALYASPDSATATLTRLFPHLAEERDTFSVLAAEEHARELDPVEFATMVFGLEGRQVVALRSQAPTYLRIDDGPWIELRRVADSSLCFTVATVPDQRTYRFSVRVGNLVAGTSDFAAYGPSSFSTSGVGKGVLTGPHHVESAVYPGAVTSFWTYANAGAGRDGECPVMVWHDGQNYLDPADTFLHRLKTVSDNLVDSKSIPAMVHVLVAPSEPTRNLPLQYSGQTQQDAMRSLQYDTVSDRYGWLLLSEILPEVAKLHPIRRDGYSRATVGLSSGGICAFTLGWFHSQDFSRVASGIGSFTGLRWEPGQPDLGGFLYPHLIRRAPRKNLRVWISEGSWDVDVTEAGRADTFGAGSWPLANLALAQSLGARGYDYHLRFGDAGHNWAQTALDLPAMLTWLWRDYDPSLTDQDFAQGRTPHVPLRVRLTN